MNVKGLYKRNKGKKETKDRKTEKGSKKGKDYVNGTFVAYAPQSMGATARN